MKFSTVIAAFAANVLAAPSLVARDGGKFGEGQPIDADGKGGRIDGGTDKSVDIANQDNLGRQATDNGVVPNLKWRFSDSKTRLLKGGWVREQVVTDLPSSHDIAGAQQHLKKGAIRELHWHRTAEWGIIYKGGLIISIVDENGVYQDETLGYGDVWYFPKGTAHTVQGTEEDNEFLLIFDDANFDQVGTTFNIDDWLAHTPKDVLAKNFGVPESVFDKVPAKNPYILPASVAKQNVTGAVTPVASGKSSFVYRTLQHQPETVGGNGGTFYKIDSTNFPVAKTIAATFVTLKPGALRELHWHPNAEEWLYFHKGKAQATVFIGNSNARTFDFSAGDTAVFPDNAGHYIENTGDEDLVWIEIYKSDRVADIPLSQWLALTPPELVSQTLNVSLDFVEHIKKEKQVFVQ